MTDTHHKLEELPVDWHWVLTYAKDAGFRLTATVNGNHYAVIRPTTSEAVEAMLAMVKVYRPQVYGG